MLTAIITLLLSLGLITQPADYYDLSEVEKADLHIVTEDLQM